MTIQFSSRRLLYGFCLTLALLFVPAKVVFAQAETQSEAENLSRQWNGEAIRRSVSLYLKSADEWQKIGENKKASACLREAARLSLFISDYEKTFAALEKALKLDAKTSDAEGKTLTLSLLSRAANQKGDVKKSEIYYKQALDTAKSSVSDTAQANALFAAAEYNSAYGTLNETVRLYEQALVFAEKTGDRDLIAHILINIGYSHARQDNPIYGLQKVREALAKWQETDDKRGQALANFGIGFLYTLMDEKQNALDFYKKAETMFPDDADWLEKAKLFNGMATVYERYGDFALGEIYRRKALELYEKAEFPYGKLPTLVSLAKLSTLKGDKAAGEKLFETALALAKQTNDRFHLAVIKETLGNFDLTNGDYDKAIKNFQEAHAVYKKLNIVLPRVENALGLAFEKKGDLTRARGFYESALKTNRKIRDVIPAADNLFNLARLSKTGGDLETALAQIKESLQITDSVYYDVANTSLRKNYLSNVFARYELYINLLMQKSRLAGRDELAREALQNAEKSRARVMLENLSLAEADLTKDADADSLRREKEIRVLLNLKTDTLSNLLGRNADQSETDKISGEIRELENELEEIKAKLKQQSPVYSAIKNPAPFDVTDFQQNVLDNDSILLEFFFGAEESYLWLVGKNEIGSYILPPRAEIESHIESLRGLLKERELKAGESVEDFQRRISEAETEYARQARELSRKLFGQIADKLGGNRLIIVPDGKLHYFPVAALPKPNSDEPLLLSNETVYEPSAQTLSVLTKSRKQFTLTMKNLLVFSDPVFASDDPRLASANRDLTEAETAPETENFRFVESLSSLTRLAASKDESETIIKALGDSAAENYAGFAATRENLLTLKTGDYRILHFATHGYVNEQRPELSGIVLSGFDEKGRKLNQLFRIQDIYALDLNADLVVLSACETGIGKEVKGEGLMSLNNAFLQTGAKTVVASLWKVEDGATLELMKNFYGAMARENLPPSEALRRAQIILRENPRYNSPFYWAAFTVQGDYRSAPQISGGSSVFWLYLLPVLTLALAGFYFYRRRKAARKAVLTV